MGKPIILNMADQPIFFLFITFIFYHTAEGCETSSLYGTVVELFKTPFVIQPLQNPLFCGSTGCRGGGVEGGGWGGRRE